MPHAVVGYVTDEAGAVVPEAAVRLENDRTGASITSTTNSLGQYSADLSSMTDGYQAGDVIRVSADSDGLVGSALVTVTANAFDMCNVTVGVAPVDGGNDLILPAIIVVLAVAAVVAFVVLRRPARPGDKPGDGKGRRRQR